MRSAFKGQGGKRRVFHFKYGQVRPEKIRETEKCHLLKI